MFSASAQYYDLIYSFKDYEHEANEIEKLIKREHPTAKSILDVACGTAEHAKYLSDTFKIDGIDIDSEFVRIAQNKIPASQFWNADMSNFDIGGRYDVVQCLFSSIGYLLEPEQVINSLVCCKKHLNPGGIIIIEPWFSPDQWIVGTPHMLTVDEPELKICRMNTSAREGNISIIDFHYLIGSSEGVLHLEESHRLALYTIDQMLNFFEQASLAVRYDPDGIFGRGLYVANIDGT